ncbi:MAG TPA: phosphodiester glycosidase family protein [Chitinophagaceae bacterium]|nr:phosphodiester glycosidase family protein [Chitinophagaceae bacterium]
MSVHKFVLIITALCLITSADAQLKWKNVDKDFNVVNGIHVYYCNDSLDGKPFRAFYIKADLKDKQLQFTSDTSYKRRLTPREFYEKNKRPVVVVNCTFFSFETNQNLNVVMKDGKLLSYNVHTVAGRGKDTLTYRHPLASAIGISGKRKADIAWVFTDSTMKKPYAVQWPIDYSKDSSPAINFNELLSKSKDVTRPDGSRAQNLFQKWKMQTAVGGGPVLVQNGEIKITNNEELKFAGKAIEDKHPRTAMGYTKNDELIILVAEGRNAGVADGVTLKQEAQILIDLGCYEALNLDGGGSSCLLVNGKETIKPSDKTGQRPIPAVFIIKRK